MAATSPLQTYQERHGEAVVLLDAAARKLAAAPGQKAKRVERAAQLHHDLTKAQLEEAQARRAVAAAIAHRQAWSGHRWVFVWRNVALVLWAPIVAGLVLMAWALALLIGVVGLLAFLAAAARSSHRAAEAGGALGEVGAKLAPEAGMAALGPLRRGSLADLAERTAACDAASAKWEDTAVALLQAERGMPYTQVLPLAGLDETTAQRIELAVAVIRGADRKYTGEEIA